MRKANNRSMKGKQYINESRKPKFEKEKHSEKQFWCCNSYIGIKKSRIIQMLILLIEQQSNDDLVVLKTPTECNEIIGEVSNSTSKMVLYLPSVAIWEASSTSGSY